MTSLQHMCSNGILAIKEAIESPVLLLAAVALVAALVWILRRISISIRGVGKQHSDGMVMLSQPMLNEHQRCHRVCPTSTGCSGHLECRLQTPGVPLHSCEAASCELVKPRMNATSAHLSAECHPDGTRKTVMTSGWLAQRCDLVDLSGEQLSQMCASDLRKMEPGWLNATVPFTALSTLVANCVLPEPLVGLNNAEIPDVFHASGRAFYTFWYCRSFAIPAADGQEDDNDDGDGDGEDGASVLSLGDRHTWLHLSGVNYSIRAFLNGAELAFQHPKGPFLRHRINITNIIAAATSTSPQAAHQCQHGISSSNDANPGASHGSNSNLCNNLAIEIQPPDHPGCVDKGGQGGDHMIAKDVTPQFSEGWDWMCPIRDRNTGIWGEVAVETTGPIVLENLHVVAEPKLHDGGAAAALSPGYDDSAQAQQEARYSSTAADASDVPALEAAPADVRVAVSMKNVSRRPLGVVIHVMVTDCDDPEGEVASAEEILHLKPGQTLDHVFSSLSMETARLWWPLGMGPQPLYSVTVTALLLPDPDCASSKTTSRGRSGKTTDRRGRTCADKERMPVSHRLRHHFGVRKVHAALDPNLRDGCVFHVNDRRVFIRGGNWIVPDGMMRADGKRFRQEVEFHAHMRLNCIRLWGGVGLATPEMLRACDELGVLVWFEFWITGDCNGRGPTPDSPISCADWPLDHELFLRCAKDTISWVRNHPSVLLWCGGNEQHPAQDLNRALAAMLGGQFGSVSETGDTRRPLAPLPLDSSNPVERHEEVLDWTRPYFQGSMWGGLAKGNGEFSDGPYGGLEPASFFRPGFYPYAFNPEVGSVGVPVVESMRAFFPEPWQQEPPVWVDVGGGRMLEIANEAWEKHTHMPYTTEADSPAPGNLVAKFGIPSSLEEYCESAQAANYDEYRALLEAWGSGMWTSYSGMLIWKTQNPWPGLRGQLYDWWGDVTGGMFGARSACEPLHCQINLHSMQLEAVNTTLHAEEVEVHWEVLPTRLCQSCAMVSSCRTKGRIAKEEKLRQMLLMQRGVLSAPTAFQKDEQDCVTCSTCGFHSGVWSQDEEAVEPSSSSLVLQPQSLSKGPCLKLPWHAIPGDACFVSVKMTSKKTCIEESRNVYWFHKEGSDFKSLRHLDEASLAISLTMTAWTKPVSAAPTLQRSPSLQRTATIALTNTDQAVTVYMIRLKLMRLDDDDDDDPSRSGGLSDHQRVPWVQYSDNYITLPPLCCVNVTVTFHAAEETIRSSGNGQLFALSGRGWNTEEVIVRIPVDIP